MQDSDPDIDDDDVVYDVKGRRSNRSKGKGDAYKPGGSSKAASSER